MDKPPRFHGGLLFCSDRWGWSHEQVGEIADHQDDASSDQHVRDYVGQVRDCFVKLFCKASVVLGPPDA